MTASVTPVAPWRLKVVAISFLSVAVLCFIISAAAIFFNFRDAALQNAYRTATACASPTDALSGETCRFSGEATVVGSSRPNLLSVDLTFAGTGGRTFTATFAKGTEPDSASVTTGARATGELWNGQVTKFAGVATTDDPANLPPNLLIGGIFFAAAFALMLFWGLQSARQARRR